MHARSALALLALSALAATGCTAVPAPPPCAPGLRPGLITTLYFGLSRADGPDIPESDWRDFLGREMLSRLPGATVSEGRGYSRAPDGTVVAEPARTVTIGHDGSPAMLAALDEISAIYKARFAQWGVGRTDAAACTNF